jgi:hypothetical protein
MKLVLSPDMVAHKWANKQQDSARNSGNTLFFEGDTIYSYGRHFPIAKHVSGAVLFTTRTYSNTTAKHISIVRHASNHLKKIYCNNPADSIASNFEAFEKNIKSELAGLARAKKPMKYISAAQSVFEEAKNYAEYFNVEVPQHLYDLIDSATSGKYAEYLSREQARWAEEEKIRQAGEVLKAKKQLAEWRKGKLNRLYNRLDDKDYLRIGNKGRIETSQNIEVPIELAKRVYKKIVGLIKLGGCNGNCDFDILGFKVNEITKEYIKVGCHKIDIKEINKMAKKIGIAK